MRTNGFEFYGRRSPRRSIAPAARRYAHASAFSQFIRTDQRGHWPWPGGNSLAACCALALSAHFAPGWRPTHVLRTPFERHRGSRLGTGVGVGYRAGALASTHPVNRSQLDRRLELATRSRPIAAPIGARFGHGPETAIACGARASRERNQWTNRKISPGCHLAVVG